MRKISITLGAIIAAFAMPAAANAQSLDQVLGVISGGSSLGYNSCSYVRDDTAKTFCQINRAARLANDTSRAVQRPRAGEWQDRNDQVQQLRALQRACKAGDQNSCSRSGGTTKEQHDIAIALMEACRAGDRYSCRRMERIMRR